jgi:hypothetical protein
MLAAGEKARRAGCRSLAHLLEMLLEELYGPQRRAILRVAARRRRNRSPSGGFQVRNGQIIRLDALQ